MPLLDLQRLVVDLRTNIKEDDKSYPTAVALLAVATSRKEWREPETIEVRNVAGHDITVDRTKIAKDSTGKVFPWQYIAALRFLEAVDKGDHEDAVADHVRKPAKGEDEKPITREEILTLIKATSGTSATDPKDIIKIVVETLKGMGVKAAAMIALAFLLLGSGKVMAQQTSYASGSINSSYHSLFIAGLNGGTNSFSGTNYYTASVTNTVNVITNANWQIVSGVATNEFYYTTNVVVYVPGLLSLANYNLWDAQFSASVFGSGSGTGTNAWASWDYSSDGVFWQTNALVEVLGLQGVNQVTTNVTVSNFAEGFARLDWVGIGNGLLGTNISVEVPLKPIGGYGP